MDDRRPDAEAARRTYPLLPVPSRARQVLWRALRLRCPRCGESALYARAFAMRERCDACGLVYEREPGYFVGAIYVNYGVTVVLALGVPWLLDATVGLGLAAQLAAGIAIAALVPIAFFRYSRSLWLAIDYLATRADERRERRRRSVR